jgi:hypothetical protein
MAEKSTRPLYCSLLSPGFLDWNDIANAILSKSFWSLWVCRGFIAARPGLDVDLGTKSREARKLCSKVGVADNDLESSSVELDPRLPSLVECLRLSIEAVFSFDAL